MIKRALLVLFASLTLLSLNSVNDTYRPLQSNGNIPGIFLNDLDNYVKLQESLYEDYFQDEKLEQLKEKLFLVSALNNGFYFRSGLVLFGDPITNYLNKVKSTVFSKNEELVKNVNIFTLKSSEVNAFCTLDGNIYITLGLMARLNSEAELAYIISHEAAHYLKKHSVEQLKDYSEIEKLSKNRKKLTLDDVLSVRLKRSKSHEFEADSVGFDLFLESQYQKTGAIEALNNLAFAHRPVGELSFDKAFFNKEYFAIPDCFFQDSTKKLTAQENLNDKYSTHPDILKRKERIFSRLEKCSLGGADFIVSESEFFQAKDLAVKELISRYLSNRNYAEALYTSFNLLNKYPNMEFLHISLAKALYYSTIYKNNQSFHYAGSSYTNIEGNSQQVHYFLKQLTAVQLNTLALKVVHEYRKRYPNKTELDQMETELVNGLVIDHNVGLDKFSSAAEAEESYNSTYGSPILDTTSSKIKLRQKYKLFYLSALYQAKEEVSLKSKFDQALLKRKEIEDYKYLPYKEKRKQEKEKEKDIKQNGYGIKAKKILMLAPEYFKFDKVESDAIISSENEKENLLSNVKKLISIQTNVKIKLLQTEDLHPEDVGTYNNYCMLASWLQDRENHLKKVSVIPSFNDDFRQNNDLNEFKYVCSIDVINIKGSFQSYSFNLYKIENGENVYSNRKKIYSSTDIGDIVSFLNEDLKNIIN